mgnify:FL=1
MKKNISNLILILFLLLALIQVFINKELINETINFSIHLWATTLIPTMFPFFVISDLLIHYSITNYIPKSLKKTLSKLFGINQTQITIFFLSLLSGFPSNARNTKNYYQENQLTKEEAEQTLTFTHFPNPTFIFQTVAITFLNHKESGKIIGLSLLGGNLLIALLQKKKTIPKEEKKERINNKQTFGTILIQSISSAINSLLLILGTITTFLVASSIIIKNLNLAPYPSMILKGILEITMGLKELSLLNLSLENKIILSTMFLSFGGLSVHLQVISQLQDTKISYLPFLQARIIHSILSGGIAFLLLKL